MTQPPPPSQPPYGSYPPNQYGPPPYGFGAPEHPQATTVLILGILGLVLCQLISPFAWIMGNRVVAEIDASKASSAAGRRPTPAGSAGSSAPSLGRRRCWSPWRPCVILLIAAPRIAST